MITGEPTLRSALLCAVVLATAAAGPSTAYGQEGELAWQSTGGPPGGLGYDVRMRPGEL